MPMLGSSGWQLTSAAPASSKAALKSRMRFVAMLLTGRGAGCCCCASCC
jgi:hypothetical protein